MGLLDEIKQEAVDRGSRGTIRYEETMAQFTSEADKKGFLEALDNQAISISVICTVLKRRNIIVSDSTVRKWRIARKS
jgi:hypothetical protein